jgi:hypothetical protein
VNCLGARQARAELQVDCFHNHDRIIDHQPDRGGNSAERHQVESHPQQTHHQYGEEHRYGNHDDGYQCACPASQEEE